MSWCVVANVKPEAFGRASAPGTRHFAAGAKIWCLPMTWGDGYEQIRVIGRHRGSLRHVVLVMASDYLVNWRAKVAYHDEVKRLLVENGAWAGQQICEDTARFMATRHPPVTDLHAAAAILAHALHLLADDPTGRELERHAAAALAARPDHERRSAVLLPAEVLVLGDWLEDRGVGVPWKQLVETLERRRLHPRADQATGGGP